jgi:outer membrane receptor protein involved in Fe transport
MDLMKSTFITLIILLSGLVTLGQTGILSGTILDSAARGPLTGSHILLKDTKFGAVTDFKGSFMIKDIPPGKYTATASFIGYETVELSVIIEAGKETKVNLQLKPKPYLAEPAVITANRVWIARNLTPITVSQVSRKTLEESGESNLLPVVSRNTPSMFVTERGITGFGVADGAAGQISIRGIGGSPNTQVLVMIDGHPQYMGIFGHPLPDAYVTSDAEKVEVIRGPASILYGSNAMAGVINIITRQQTKDGLSLMANAGYGSFNTFKINGSAGYRKNKFQAYISFNHDNTDGERANSDFEINNGYMKLSYDINSNFRIWGDVNLSGYNSTNPGPEHTQDTTYQDPTHWQDVFRGYSSASFENKFDKTEGMLKFYYNWGDHKLWDGFRSHDRNYGIMLYQAWKPFKGTNITAGFDYANYGGNAKNTIPEVPVQFVDTSVYETGIYLLADQKFFDKLTVTAGIRFQYNEMFESVWIPQVGATYDFAGNTTVKVNVSKGYRSPSIRELFMFQPANPDLKPEDLWNYEAGAIQKFLDQKLSFDLNFFYNKGSNLIQTTGVYPDILNTNTGSFEHYGIEFQGRYIILDNLNVMANYSWLHTDKPTLAAPENMVYAEANYQVKGFRFRLSGQYINQLITLSDPLTEESYFILSARASYTYKFITVYLDGNNLLNEEYSINYDYPMPGINFFGGVMINLSSPDKK